MARGTDPFVGMSILSESQPQVLYRIVRRLGEGGTAVAYFAERMGPEGTSPVVLKVIQPIIMHQAGDTARLIVQKEAVALGRLNERMPPCPFVVRLMDVGSLEYQHRPGQPLALPWLAIEYVHGGPLGATLEERVERSMSSDGFAFEPARAVRALQHITEGLSEIHAVGVIHRDINPNNVLCCGSGSSEIFKLSDFGIARPIGVQATFGPSVVGTPGYIAPEQATEGEAAVGTHSDIFSLAALAFFILTGEAFMEAQNPLELIMSQRARARRSIRSTRGLAPEIREDASTCDAIDAALANATSPDPTHRPASAKAFAASLLPWLTECPPTRRTPVLSGGRRADEAPSLRQWSFQTRHPVEHDWVLSRVGWDGDGHCLGAATRGLVYFDGTKWSDVAAETLGGLGRARFATRVAAGRWLIGGEGGTVAEYSRAGITRVLRGLDPSLSLLDASGDLADLTCLLGQKPGEPPLVCATSGGRWVKPLPVPAAAALLSLSKAGDDQWFLCGRSAEGKGFAALYRPLFWELEAFAPIETRALTASASRPERGVVLAVGASGVVFRLENGYASLLQLSGTPDLSAVAFDALGRAWAGAAGELWFSENGGQSWQRVWRDPSWRAPFVSIFADAGMVFAASADGAVLECRATGP